MPLQFLASTALLLALAATSPRAHASATAGSPQKALMEKFPQLQFLPLSADETPLNVEAIFALRDVCEGDRQTEISKERLGITPIGKFLSEDLAGAFGGATLSKEISKICDWASGGKAPVPFAMLAISDNEQFYALQIMVKVQDGYMERLSRSVTNPDFKGWQFAVEENAPTLSMAGTAFTGGLSSDGWLRLSHLPNSHTWTFGPVDLFSDAVTTRYATSSGFVALRSRRALPSALRYAVEQNFGVAAIADSIQHVGMSWHASNDMRAQKFSIHAESPIFAQLATGIKRFELNSKDSVLWHEHTTGALSLSAPTAVINTFLTLLSMQQQQAPVQLPGSFFDMMSQTDGRFSWLSYGSPGDYALAIGFRDAQVAEAAITAVQDTLETVLKHLGANMQNPPWEHETSAAQKTMHLRVFHALQRTRVSALGSWLVFTGQKARLDVLQNTLNANNAKAGFLNDNLQPLVYESMAAPALMQAYMVSGDTGDIFQWLEWPAFALAHHLDAWNKRNKKEGNPLDDVFNTLFDDTKAEDLPAIIAATAHSMLWLYDMGLSADVVGNMLELNAFFSHF